MKTFRQFRYDAEEAIINQVLESKGFGEVAKKRRKKKKSYVSARTAKIQDLKNRQSSWQGLK